MPTPSAWEHTVEGQRQCWHCDRVENAVWQYDNPPGPWLCERCVADALYSGHAITQLAEEVARAIMERDWSTDQRNVRALRAIRSLVWMAGDEAKQYLDWELNRKSRRRGRDYEN